MKITTGSESESESEDNIPLSELYNRDRGRPKHRVPCKRYTESSPEPDNSDNDNDYGTARNKPRKPVPSHGPSAERIQAQQLISGRCAQKTLPVEKDAMQNSAVATDGAKQNKSGKNTKWQMRINKFLTQTCISPMQMLLLLQPWQKIYQNNPDPGVNWMSNTMACVSSKRCTNSGVNYVILYIRAGKWSTTIISRIMTNVSAICVGRNATPQALLPATNTPIKRRKSMYAETAVRSLRSVAN